VVDKESTAAGISPRMRNRIPEFAPTMARPEYTNTRFRRSGRPRKKSTYAPANQRKARKRESLMRDRMRPRTKEKNMLRTSNSKTIGSVLSSRGTVSWMICQLR